ncbi:MAG: hypothetical protein KDB07_06610 [Planctomycetes bacterium]|nr:hypothetical protein [Planctomycetota bacterium]
MNPFSSLTWDEFVAGSPYSKDMPRSLLCQLAVDICKQAAQVSGQNDVPIIDTMMLAFFSTDPEAELARLKQWIEHNQPRFIDNALQWACWNAAHMMREDLDVVRTLEWVIKCATRYIGTDWVFHRTKYLGMLWGGAGERSPALIHEGCAPEPDFLATINETKERTPQEEWNPLTDMDKAFNCLHLFGVARLEYSFSGGGDSGGVDRTACFNANGVEIEGHPHIIKSPQRDYDRELGEWRGNTEVDEFRMELQRALVKPIYDEYYSFAGEFYCSGTLCWNAIEGTMYLSSDDEVPVYHQFDNASDDEEYSDEDYEYEHDDTRTASDSITFWGEDQK